MVKLPGAVGAVAPGSARAGALGSRNDGAERARHTLLAIDHQVAADDDLDARGG